jgi:hypothetical protein
VILAFWIGLYPKPFFQILEQPVNRLVLDVRKDYPALQTNVNAAAQPSVPATVPAESNGEEPK